MVSIIRKAFSPIFFGIGASKFSKGRYREAASAFEKALKFSNGNEPGIEYHYSCLGRCYLAINEHEKAYANLKKAYELYQNNHGSLNDFMRGEYLELLKAYGTILENKGQNRIAAEIYREANEYEKNNL